MPRFKNKNILKINYDWNNIYTLSLFHHAPFIDKVKIIKYSNRETKRIKLPSNDI